MSARGITYGCCGFCQHWYDPTNSAIKPLNKAMTQWDVNNSVKNICKLKKIDTNANFRCPKYECKL